MPDRRIGRKERKGHKFGKRKMHHEGLLSGRKIIRPDVIHSSIHGAQLRGQVAAHDAQTFPAGDGAVAADPAHAGDEDFYFVGSLSGDCNSLEAPVQSQ